MLYKKLIISSLVISAFTAFNAQAEDLLTLGVKLLGGGWQGDNGSVSSSFASTKGGQIAFSAAYSVDKFYAAINLQNGRYQFDDVAPDQFTPGGRVASNNVEIQQRELDVLAGYYFWETVSVFLDLKGVSNTWSGSNYEQNFGGLGLGASAFHPLNSDWTAFGSAGFIGSGEVKDANKVKVGEGTSSALELGAIYRLAPDSTLNMGIKFRNYRLEYLNNSTQDYSVNALFIGYNHAFTM